MSPAQQRSLLAAILGGGSGALTGSAFEQPEPEIRAAPTQVRGFRIRLDLIGAKPPVWRRLELPGDVTLDRLHLVIQAAMGWLDSHLHRLRTGGDHRSPYFATPYDVEEGEDGTLEGGVRLDQLVAEKGDRLWYEYDFGDGWDHVLAVESVTDEPVEVRCLAGGMACPPEDCGGIWGYTELAEWVRDGCDPASVPQQFDDAGHARDWLPLNWDPDQFLVDEANAVLTALFADPVPVAAGLDELRQQLERTGNRTLTGILASSAAHASVEVSGTEAARLVEPFVTLLDVIGDGVRLTGAGYLPPALVERIAEETGVTDWWIGKANREDLTVPVAQLRDSARALGLVSVRKGRLGPSAAGRRFRTQPEALWRHVVSRLPVARSDFDRHAGWLSLAVVGSEAPAEVWDDQVRDLLFSVGWRLEGSPFIGYVSVTNPTLDILELLAGRTSRGHLTGVDPAVAATARAVLSVVEDGDAP